MMKSSQTGFEPVPTDEEEADGHDGVAENTQRLSRSSQSCFGGLFLAALVAAMALLALHSNNHRHPTDAAAVVGQTQQGVAAAVGTLQNDASNRWTATVRIPFDVEPKDQFGIQVDVDARKYFPSQDIFIKSFTFAGVQVDSEIIPVHTDAWANDDQTVLRRDVLYTFHHSLLHQGHQLVTGREQGLLDFHRNGGIVYGTHLHTTSFGEYGLRLRPDTRIFACQFGRNRSRKTKTFVTVWEIEYELVEQEMHPDDDEEKTMVKPANVAHAATNPKHLRPLVCGWLHARLPNRAILNDQYVFTHTVQAEKDLKMVGWIYHHHPWLYQLDVLDSKNATVWSHDGSPSDDGILEFLPHPIEMQASSTLTFVMYGRATFKGDLDTPSGVSFFVEFHDGSDRVEEDPNEFFTISKHVEHVIDEL